MMPMQMISLLNLAGRNLTLQRDLKTATMVYKSLNGLAPDYLKSMFTNRSAISTYSLRNCEGKLAVPLPRTQFSKKQFQLQWCVAVEQLTYQSAASAISC